MVAFKRECCGVGGLGMILRDPMRALVLWKAEEEDELLSDASILVWQSFEAAADPHGEEALAVFGGEAVV